MVLYNEIMDENGHISIEEKPTAQYNDSRICGKCAKFTDIEFSKPLSLIWPAYFVISFQSLAISKDFLPSKFVSPPQD